MAGNPFKEAKKQIRDKQNFFALDLGRVLQAPDDAGHRVKVEVLADGESSPIVATVGVSEIGDINVPMEGDLVVIGYFKNSLPVILQTVYDGNSTVPAYSSGDRVVGNGKASIRIAADGAVTVESATKVRLENDAPLEFEDENGDTVTLFADGGELKVTDANDNTTTLS